ATPPTDLDQVRPILPGDEAIAVLADLDVQADYRIRGRFPGFGGKGQESIIEVEGPNGPVIRYIIDPGSAPDTMYLDAESLALTARRLLNPFAKYRMDIRVEQNRVVAELEKLEGADPNLPSLLEGELPHAVFEVNTLDLVLASLPLEAGYLVKLPYLVLEQPPTVQWMRVEVAGRDTVELADGPIGVWRVELHASSGERTTVWVDPATTAKAKASYGRTGRTWTRSGSPRRQ
ncbi:MAG: hypothetical protein HKM89_08270, partial [Gemmatimonadales bacterium]|nr:hypothetical protein [Gemmatimonadales bacterium]